MKSGAPPDKVRVLHCLLPIEFHGFTSRIVKVAFLENATIEYSLESLCVCPCLCVCVCVFLQDNSKRNRSRNTKLEYIVEYENSSDKFDTVLRQIKVKVTVGVQKFNSVDSVSSISQLWIMLGSQDSVVSYI